MAGLAVRYFFALSSRPRSGIVFCIVIPAPVPGSVIKKANLNGPLFNLTSFV